MPRRRLRKVVDPPRFRGYKPYGIIKKTKEIKTVYGNALMDKNWVVCTDCNTRFTIPKTIEQQKCLICSSNIIESLKV